VSSFVEVKGEALSKALELIDAIEVGDDGPDKHAQSIAVLNLVQAAATADNAAQQDAWAKSQASTQSEGVPRHGAR
jgi:hypothetical protein